MVWLFPELRLCSEVLPAQPPPFPGVSFSSSAGCRKLFCHVKGPATVTALQAAPLSFGIALAQLVAKKLPHALGGSCHVLAGMLNLQIWRGLSYSCIGRRGVVLGVRRPGTSGWLLLSHVTSGRRSDIFYF